MTPSAAAVDWDRTLNETDPYVGEVSDIVGQTGIGGAVTLVGFLEAEHGTRDCGYVDFETGPFYSGGAITGIGGWGSGGSCSLDFGRVWFPSDVYTQSLVWGATTDPDEEVYFSHITLSLDIDGVSHVLDAREHYLPYGSLSSESLPAVHIPGGLHDFSITISWSNNEYGPMTAFFDYLKVTNADPTGEGGVRDQLEEVPRVPGPGCREFFSETVCGAVEELPGDVHELYQQVEQEANDAYDDVDRAVEDALDDVDPTIDQLEETIGDAADDAERTAWETKDDAERDVNDAIEDAQPTIDLIWQTVDGARQDGEDACGIVLAESLCQPVGP